MIYCEILRKLRICGCVPKEKKKHQMDQHKTLLATHLTEFMRRRKFGDHSLENLIRCLQFVYPTL